MNIGLFSDTYYPQINGVVTSTRMLERELNKLGHTVFVFTTTDPKVEYSVPRVFRMPSMPLVFLPSHRFTYLYSPKMLANLKSLKLDIVHTQTEFPIGIFGKLVSEFNHIPMIHTYHTMYEDYVHYILNGHLITPKLAQRLSRLFCNRAQEVIAPVEKTKDYLTEIGVVRRLNVVPTGIDFTPFQPENFTKERLVKARADLGIGGDDPVIVTVGRVAKEKSMDVLIKQMPELLARMPALKLLIVGDGPMREGLADLAGYLNVRPSVIFTGFVPWDTVPLYYRLGDVFATASTSETQGLTYIEAIASGLPVVVKRDRSVEGIVTNNETGFMFDRDEDAADALYYALTHKNEAAMAAEKAKGAIQGLSSAAFAKSVEEIYKRAIEERKAKRERKLTKTKEARKKLRIKR